MDEPEGRNVKGGALIDLVKFCKNLEKTRGPFALSSATRELLMIRLLASRWYPLACFQELLELLNSLVLANDETRALEMGAAGGSTLRGVYKAYVLEGDALSSVLAMRHSWRAHYNFGIIKAEVADDKVVLFEIDDYPDISMVHALMTAGWGVGAARAAGVHDAHCIVHDRPWTGAAAFRYRIVL